MKRADTTRQHLDAKADEEDGIPIHEILAVIDTPLAKSEEHSKSFLDADIPSGKRRRDDAASVIVDYAISKGVSSVYYVMKTLSDSLKYE